MNALQDEVLSDERDVSNDSMAVLASSTGGKFFHNSNDIAGGLVEIAALPEVTYALSFYPDDLKENGVYHSLKVKVPGMHDVTISARPGYFAQSHEKNSPSAKFQKLNKEVMASDSIKEVGADVTTQSGTIGTGETALKVIVHVNGKSLIFKKENNVRNERLIFITALFDLNNHYLGGNEAVMDMNLKDASFAQISKEGVDARTTLQAPPGTYRLREVVQDVVGGRFAASPRTVEIRERFPITTLSIDATPHSIRFWRERCDACDGVELVSLMQLVVTLPVMIFSVPHCNFAGPVYGHGVSVNRN